MNRLFYYGCLLLTTSLLSACGAVLRTTPFHQPSVNIPESWNTQLTGERFAQTDNFWESFQDPQLNQLIVKMLAVNNELAIASLTVKEARHNKEMTVLDILLPDLATSGGINKTAESPWKNDFKIGLGYQIDLFKQLSAERSANWRVRETEADRRTIALTAISNTADLYWKIAYLKQGLNIIEKRIDNAKSIEQLNQAKFEAGTISKLQWATTQQQLLTILNLQKEYQQALIQSQHKLPVLLNQSPQQFSFAYNDLMQVVLPTFQADLPAKVLMNRPDIQAAEYKARQALIAIDNHRNILSPIFNLSMPLLDLISNPSYVLTAAFAPISWKSRQKDVVEAKIEYEKSIVTYRDKIYKALGEVEGLLLQYQLDQEKNRYLSQSLNLALEQEHIAQTSYSAGSTNKMEWLEKQDLRYQLEFSTLEHRYQQLTHIMALYLALGGGKLKVLND